MEWCELGDFINEHLRDQREVLLADSADWRRYLEWCELVDWLSSISEDLRD